jgi:hypothetical protein
MKITAVESILLTDPVSHRGGLHRSPAAGRGLNMLLVRLETTRASPAGARPSATRVARHADRARHAGRPDADRARRARHRALMGDLQRTLHLLGATGR